MRMCTRAAIRKHACAHISSAHTDIQAHRAKSVMKGKPNPAYALSPTLQNLDGGHPLGGEQHIQQLRLHILRVVHEQAGGCAAAAARQEVVGGGGREGTMQ